jgi:predicted nuclease with TOPRIM domain
MARLNIDEFKAKYNEKITDNDDLLIELFEDASDSFSSDEEVERLTEENNNLRSEIEKKDEEINDIKSRYKERFLTGEEVKEEVIENTGLKEEEIIDVKVI